jgi:hypothetical protein
MSAIIHPYPHAEICRVAAADLAVCRAGALTWAITHFPSRRSWCHIRMHVIAMSTQYLVGRRPAASGSRLVTQLLPQVRQLIESPVAGQMRMMRSLETRAANHCTLLPLARLGDCSTRVKPTG